MSFEELNVPKNHIYLFKPHIRKPDGTYKFGAHAGMIIVIK